jgi:hypothetical protein
MASSGGVRIIVGLFVLGVGLRANAAPIPTGGTTSLAIKDNATPAKRRAVFSTKAPNVPMPGDVATVGGTLQLINPVTAQASTVWSMPASAWVCTAGKVCKYTDKLLTNGPIMTATLKPGGGVSKAGSFKAILKGASLDYALIGQGAQGHVGVIVNYGASDGVCTLVPEPSATAKKDDPVKGQFKASRTKGAAADASCPTLPVSTTTTSSTSTSTTLLVCTPSGSPAPAGCAQAGLCCSKICCAAGAVCGPPYAVDTCICRGTGNTCFQNENCCSGSCNLITSSCNGPTTTTTSSTTSTSTSSTTTTLQSGCFQDWGDGTIHDTCTGLQWEKKDGTPAANLGEGEIPTDLHNVNNLYSWAGCCNGDCSTVANFCQPNAAAATTCAAHADGGTQGCSTCASGTCNVDPFSDGALTTVWDWLNQVNAATFAGHSDWRLPSEGGNNSPSTGGKELESIFDGSAPGCGTGLSSSCINAIFGPSAEAESAGNYWSASTDPTLPGPLGFAWVVDFGNGDVYALADYFGLYVRAVR